jgi:hypothetical protein
LVLILQTRNQSTILLLADALSFQMAAFFYTAAMQTGKSRLTDTTTNLPAKMVTTMVMLAAAAVEMVVSGNGSCGEGDNNLEYVTQPKKMRQIIPKWNNLHGNGGSGCRR